MPTAIHVLSRAVIVAQGSLLVVYDPRSPANHYYQPGPCFYYLPGGHIEFQESATTALTRELREEMGLSSEVESFLGVLEHTWPRNPTCCHTHEINLIFKVHIPGLQAGQPIAPQEAHVAFHWIDLTQLSTVDLRPEPLKTLIPQWIQPETPPSLYSLMLTTASDTAASNLTASLLPSKS